MRHHKRTTQTDQVAKEQFGGSRAIAAAGVLVLLSMLGPAVDALWLALVPAAAALGFGAGKMAKNARKQGHRSLMAAASALAASSGLLVILALAGLSIQQVNRTEPGWLTESVTWGGRLFIGSLVVFGLAGVRQESFSRLSGLALVGSLPFGLVLDALFERIPHFFLQGFGFSVGLGLLGLSLVLISRKPRSPEHQTSRVARTAAPHPTG